MTYRIGIAEIHRATLQLSTHFSESELRLAYRRLIRKWHPDRYISQPNDLAEATEMAKQINVAYEYLSEFLDNVGGTYCAPASTESRSWSSSDLQPKRTYEGKTYKAGFPDPAVLEIFLKSSAFVSTGYNRFTKTLYLKFSSGAVYKYFDVPEEIFEEFMHATSHGRFGHFFIYRRYRQARC